MCIASVNAMKHMSFMALHKKQPWINPHQESLPTERQPTSAPNHNARVSQAQICEP